MSKDPAFLFYPADYIIGTMGMSFEEKGAYMELLMMQFSRGHMTSLMIGQVVGQLWDKIKDKFAQDENGLWYNERLEMEKMKRINYTESRRNNMSGKNQYSIKDKNKQGHMTSHMENENENKDANEKKGDARGIVAFDMFWDLYDKKVDRTAAEPKWNKLNQKEQQDIMIFLPDYVASTHDKAFRKDPATFLNRRAWENEIIRQNNNKVLQNDSDFD